VALPALSAAEGSRLQCDISGSHVCANASEQEARQHEDDASGNGMTNGEMPATSGESFCALRMTVAVPI